MALDLASTNQNQGTGSGTAATQPTRTVNPQVSFFAGLLEAATEVQLLLDTEGRIVLVGGCPEFVMGYARSSPQTIRGRLMPVIVYDPATGRESFGATMRKFME